MVVATDEITKNILCMSASVPEVAILNRQGYVDSETMHHK